MKIWILTSDSKNFSSLAVKSAFNDLGLSTEVLDPHLISFHISSKTVDFFYNSKAIEKPHITIPRLGWNSLEAGLVICGALESAGVKVINPVKGYKLAAHKLESILKLRQHQIPVPDSKFAHPTQASENFLIPTTESLVFKQFYGSQGFGVTWSKEKSQALSMIDFLRNSKTQFYTQQLIEESYGKDLRVFVANGKILGAMERINSNDLRSNLQKGGTAKAVSISSEISDLAKNCLKHLELFYGGVDILHSKNGPLVIEVNPAPGFEGISKAMQLNIAKIFAGEVIGGNNNVD